jgi:phage tail sheath gpL-like
VGASTAGVEGTTTEAANLATALASLDAVRKYYIVTSVNTATALANLETHIVTKSEPKRGLRSVGISAFTGSLAAGQTIATGLNYERMQIAWQPNSEHDCAELAAAMAAVRQKREQVDTSYNFNGESLSPYIKPVFYVADRPDGDDIEDAIIDGLTVISSSDSGTNIVHSVSTRSKDATGVFDDSRASRTVKVSTSDAFVDDLLVRYALRYGQSKFKDDERNADGTVNTNQKNISGVVRPSYIVGTITELVDDYADEHLQEIDAIKASISVFKSETNPGRAACGMDLHVIDWLDQITTRVAEVSIG